MFLSLLKPIAVWRFCKISVFPSPALYPSPVLCGEDPPWRRERSISLCQVMSLHFVSTLTMSHCHSGVITAQALLVEMQESDLLRSHPAFDTISLSFKLTRRSHHLKAWEGACSHSAEFNMRKFHVVEISLKSQKIFGLSIANNTAMFAKIIPDQVYWLEQGCVLLLMNWTSHLQQEDCVIVSF